MHLHQGHIYSNGIKQTHTKDQVHVFKKWLHVLPGPIFAIWTILLSELILTYMLSLIYLPTFLNTKWSFSQFLIINKRLKTVWETKFKNKEKLGKRCPFYGSSQRNTFTQTGKHFWSRSKFPTHFARTHSFCRKTYKSFWSQLQSTWKCVQKI